MLESRQKSDFFAECVTFCGFRKSFNSDVVIALSEQGLTLPDYQPFIHVTQTANAALK